MKTAEEILRDELSEHYWEIITKQDEEGHTTFKDWIIEAMEAYASQRDTEPKEGKGAEEIINGFKETLKYELKAIIEKLEVGHNRNYFEGQRKATEYALEMIDKHASLPAKQSVTDESENEKIVEFMEDVNHMRRLYSNNRYTQADEWKNKLSERLDDIMRIQI